METTKDIGLILCGVKRTLKLKETTN